jgi:hypothetical protein
MRRIITLMLVALLLGGCVDASAKIKTDKSIVKIGKEEAKISDLYEKVVTGNGAAAVQKFVEGYLFDKVVGDKVSVDTLAKEQLDNVKSLMGDNFPKYLEQLKYDETTYVDRIIVPQIKAQEVAFAYLGEKFDTIMATYTPVKMAVAQFAKEEDADKANAELLAGGDLAKIAIKYGAKTNIGTVQVFTNKSDLPKEVLSIGVQADKPFITETPIASTDKTAFYVVQVVETDYSKFKTDIELKLKKEPTFQDEAVVYYLSVYPLVVHDKLANDIITQTLPQYLR